MATVSNETGKQKRNDPKPNKPKPRKRWEEPGTSEAKRLRDQKHVTPFVEALELKRDAIDGQLAGLFAVKDGTPTLAINALTGRDAIVALNGGLREDRRRALAQIAEDEKGGADSETMQRARDDLAKVDRQIAAVNVQIKNLIAEKTTLDDMITRIYLARRRLGGVRCKRRPLDTVEPSEKTLASLNKTRDAARDEKDGTESGDRGENEALEIALASVDRLAAKAAPLLDMTAAFDAGEDNVRDLRLFGIARHGSGDGEMVERSPLLEFMCEVFRDPMKEYVKRRNREHYEDFGPALNAEERAAKIKQLRKKISELDWQIAAQVRALHAIGRPANYPTKISIWAVLELQPVKEPRQFRDRIGREEEL